MYIKMECTVFFFLLAVVCSVLGKPLDSDFGNNPATNSYEEHKLTKRFINPMFNLDSFPDTDFTRIRAKRSDEDECEKLRLCKLHARSSYSFFAAYELYFVNKENARLWDHHSRSMADCEQRYGDCYRR